MLIPKLRNTTDDQAQVLRKLSTGMVLVILNLKINIHIYIWNYPTLYINLPAFYFAGHMAPLSFVKFSE